MRAAHFAACRPVCPRCLHGSGTIAPLEILDAAVSDGDTLIHGTLVCPSAACRMEFPVIDGAPVLLADPGGWLREQSTTLLARDDLPGVLNSVIGDALGPGSAHDVARQHLSLYAGAQFGAPEPWPLSAVIDAAFPDPVDGPLLDLGAATGRGTLELGRRGLALGAELNPVMIRFAQALLRTGSAPWAERQGGLVYADRTADWPDAAGRARADLWVMDALALPFETGSVAGAAALNVLDCVPGPVNLIAETARVLAPGATAVFTSPYDWTGAASEPAMWLGGHSARGPGGGDSRAALRQVLDSYGFAIEAEHEMPGWTLTLHSRARMVYDLHVVVARRI